MLTINVDTAKLDRAAAVVIATEEQMKEAIYCALKETQKSIETDLRQQASKKLRIPQKALGKRFFTRNLAPGDEELRVWVGTWNISPYSIGAPTQDASGVKAGRHSYPGAFLSMIYSGTEKVWIRLYSKHYSKDLYPTNYRPGNRGIDQINRFPVVRAAVPIDAVLEKLLDQRKDQYARTFEEIYLREMNNVTTIEGAR